MNNKTLLLVGTYCGLNKGDRLMQQMVASFARARGVHVVLASPFPEIDSDIYDFPVVRSRRRNLPLSVIKLSCLYCLPSGLRIKASRFDDELKYYLEADLVIDLSGDMLTEDYGPHIAFSHALPLLYARLLGRPYSVIAQSVGPFKFFKFLYVKLLNQAKKVTVREGVSKEYLEKIGVSGVVETADLGFLVRPKKLDSKVSGKRRFMAVAPSGLLNNKFSAFQGNEGALDLFADVLNAFAKRHELDILLVPHVLTPSGAGGDDEVCRGLQSRLIADSEILCSSSSAEFVKLKVSSAFMLLAFRMHAAIAGLDSYVPTLAVSYSHKTEGLFDKLGLPKWVVRNDEKLYENMSAKLEDLIASRDEVIATLHSNVPLIRKKAELNMLYIERDLFSDA